MKKYMKAVFLTILLIFNMGLSICLAEDHSANPWTVGSYKAIVEIGSDGSMKIEEYIEYSFTEEFTGELLRDIDTSAASGVDDLEIFVGGDGHDDTTEAEPTPLEPVSYEVLLDDEYEIVRGVNISIEPGAQKKSIVYRYKLNDLVGIYNDMALLDWTFLKNEEDFPGKQISISVKLPHEVDRDAMGNVLEGPLYTELDIDGNLLEYNSHLMDKGRDLRLIILLPKSSFPEGRKMIDNEITAKVQEGISQYENEIETTRSEYEVHLKVRQVMSYLGFGILILTFLYLYIKYGHGPKVEIKEPAYGELPADYYTPAELGVLMNRGKVKPNYMVATLIDLYNRGYLHIVDPGKEGFTLLRNEAANAKELKSHEEYLLGWIFGDIGHGASKVTTEAIFRWNNDHENRKRYKHKYNTWKRLVTTQAQSWKFFEDVGGAKLMGLLSGLIGLVPGIILLIFDEILLGATITVLAFALVLYSRFIFKPTEFGAMDRAKWKAFMKQVEGAPSLNAKSLQAIDYEKLLGYSIPLGIWKDLLVQLATPDKDGGIEDSSKVLTHEDNLEKTREWISIMSEVQGRFRHSKGQSGHDFNGGTGISQ